VSYRVAHPVLFGFSWSIATELEFYLVWPLLLIASRTPRRALVLLLAMLVVDQAAERGLFAGFLAARGVYAGISRASRPRSGSARCSRSRPTTKGSGPGSFAPSPGRACSWR
jgi:hypothetical protein